MKANIEERTVFLRKELRRYEEITDMTDEERTALHEWVSEGNSVHENGSMGCLENGEPADFLEDYRYQEEIRKELELLAPSEQETYIARLHGGNTVETLLEDLSELSAKAEAYRRVLKKYGLLKEAEALMKDWKAGAAVLPKLRERNCPLGRRITGDPVDAGNLPDVEPLPVLRLDHLKNISLNATNHF